MDLNYVCVGGVLEVMTKLLNPIEDCASREIQLIPNRIVRRFQVN